MKRLTTLRSASTLNDIAALLNFKASALAYLLYKLPPAARYIQFQIPKRAGGMRLISAPIPQLKVMQQNLANLLQDCWAEICVAAKRRDNIAHGFKRGRSVFSNARMHRNRNYVFNTDIKDFFPSINFGRVRGYFISDSNFGLNQKVATIVAQIACHENALPQGSPCSPIISNLIAHILDIQLVVLARKVGCTYSRYADDLSFSTNKSDFPNQIAERDAEDPHSWHAGVTLQKIVKRSGFEINHTKSRVQYHDSRQSVTGLVVNRKVNIRCEYRYTVRAMVHKLLKTGAFEVRDHTGTLGPGSPVQLHGMLSFIDFVDLNNRFIAFINSDKRDTLRIPSRELTPKKFGRMSSIDNIGPLTKRELLFQSFLVYSNFYAAQKPTIVCEGATDNVYLLHAIHSLVGKFKALASKAANGSITLHVRLFRSLETRTGRLLGMGDGGSSPLGKLIDTYMRFMKNVQAPQSSQPVILLADNDSGKTAIYGMLKKYKIAVAPSSPIIHVRGNLYVMHTPPLPGNAETTIEDFFDAKTKATAFAGKTFNPAKDADPALYIGKTIFAHQIVRPNAKTIDFSGFSPILTTISQTIEKASLAAAASTKTP